MTNKNPVAESESKQCSTCRRYFPGNLGYFNKKYQSKDGLTYICKDCLAKKERERREKVTGRTAMSYAERRQRRRRALEMHSDGFPIDEISSLLGVTEMTLRQWGIKKGSSWQELQLARDEAQRMLDNGYTNREIASFFGVDPTYISRLRLDYSGKEKLEHQKKAAVATMREKGLTWVEIGRTLGIDERTARLWYVAVTNS